MTFIDQLNNTIPNEYKHQLAEGVVEFAEKHYKEELDCLYYGRLVVLPLSVEGEIELERLLDEEAIGNYGYTSNNFNHNNTTYLALLINND